MPPSLVRLAVVEQQIICHYLSIKERVRFALCCRTTMFACSSAFAWKGARGMEVTRSCNDADTRDLHQSLLRFVPKLWVVVPKLWRVQELDRSKPRSSVLLSPARSDPIPNLTGVDARNLELVDVRALLTSPLFPHTKLKHLVLPAGIIVTPGDTNIAGVTAVPAVPAVTAAATTITTKTVLLDMPQLTFLQVNVISTIGNLHLGALRGLPNLFKLVCRRDVKAGDLVARTFRDTKPKSCLPAELVRLEALTLIGLSFQRSIVRDWVQLSVPMRQLTSLEISNLAVTVQGNHAQTTQFGLDTLMDLISNSPLLQILHCDLENLMADEVLFATALQSAVPKLQQVRLVCRTKLLKQDQVDAFLSVLPSVHLHLSVSCRRGDAWWNPLTPINHPRCKEQFVKST